PSISGQETVIAEALAASGLRPDEIGYVEAHGTGTQLGDPIEVQALAHVFAGVGKPGQRLLGSVKSNFGHLDTAAGIAGFMKAALAVRHGVVPATLNFKTPNRETGL